MTRCLSLLLLISLLTTPSLSAQRTSEPGEVQVNCSRGQSINDALAREALLFQWRTGRPFVIEVRGICEELVDIERDDLTLRGLDPNTDGIRGPAGSATPVLRIRGGRNVRVENLQITGTTGSGIQALNGTVAVVRNCIVDQVGQDGIVSVDSVVQGDQLRITTGGNAGLNAFDADLFCRNCAIRGPRGAVASQGARISLTNTTVIADTRAVQINEHSWISVTGGSLTGSFGGQSKAVLLLNGVTHAAMGSDQHGFNHDSSVDVQSSNVLGTLRLFTFSTASLRSGRVESVSCGSGANAFCASGVVGSSTGCALCAP